LYNTAAGESIRPKILEAGFLSGGFAQKMFELRPRNTIYFSVPAAERLKKY